MTNTLSESYRATGKLMQRLANLAEDLESCVDGITSGNHDVMAGQQILRDVSEAHGLIEAIKNAHLPNVELEDRRIGLLLKHTLHNLEGKVSTIGALLNKIRDLPKYTPRTMWRPEEA